jgi:hypothetical protein
MATPTDPVARHDADVVARWHELDAGRLDLLPEQEER